MLNIIFAGVFLVIILNTASSNRNVSKELKHSNLTFNENGTAINKTKKEKYNAYVNAEMQEVWEKFLAQAEMIEFKPFKERKIRKKWTTAMAKDSAVTEARRHQVTRLIKEEKNQFEAAINAQQRNTNTKLKFEGYRQPYWKEGDYVFLRTGSPTTPAKDSKKSTNPMEVFRDCDRTCNYYFKTYGRVCGHRYNMKYWKNEYKNFANICDIDHENCIKTYSKPNWHPMYRGNCSELLPFPKMEFDYVDIVARGKIWAPYVYKAPTPTEATVDPVDKEIADLMKDSKP